MAFSRRRALLLRSIPGPHSRLETRSEISPWKQPGGVVIHSQLPSTPGSPVTAIVTVNGPDTIWVVADRRLSSQGRAVSDVARKLTFLEATDGVAILGYCGLGATALGTEPADWMSAVLRGRKLPLEQCLNVLSEAVKVQIPGHLAQIPGQTPLEHHVLVPAFVGDEARFYSIDVGLSLDRKNFKFRFTRHVHGGAERVRLNPPRLALGGSGAPYVVRRRNWARNILRVVRAHEKGLITPLTVADELAKLNEEISRTVPDNSVGPDCIVAWRHRPGKPERGGGAHQFYKGSVRSPCSDSLPTIAQGMDVDALVKTMMPHMLPSMDALRRGEPQQQELDREKINEALRRLPVGPDEKLR